MDAGNQEAEGGGMTDIVERLRVVSPDDYDDCSSVMNEAADEIERLRGLIKEAIGLARRNHYGNMYIEIENFAEGIGLLEEKLEEE